MSIEVTFTREDLLPEHRSDPTSTITFDKLGPGARAVVAAAGRGCFVSPGNYNMVYPPRST